MKTRYIGSIRNRLLQEFTLHGVNKYLSVTRRLLLLENWQYSFNILFRLQKFSEKRL